MAQPADGTGLSETQICELAGVTRQRRESWVDRGLLEEAPASGCRLREALDVAQLRALISALGPTDGVAAWQQTGEEIAAIAAEERVGVLFDLERKRAELVDEEAKLSEKINHGRPVRLVDLGEVRREVGAAFARLQEAVRTRASSGAG
jgi:hypothetical protein